MTVKHYGQDCEIRFRHRHYDPPLHIVSRRYRKPQDRWVRGYTKVEMWFGVKKIAHDGAWCSREDWFDHHVGRRTAFRHLLENWGFTRAERAEMWAGFWEAERAMEAKWEARYGEAVVREAKRDSGEEVKETPILHPTNGSGVPLQQAESNSAA